MYHWDCISYKGFRQAHANRYRRTDRLPIGYIFCSFNVDCSWNRPIGVAVTQNTDIPVIKVNGK